MHPVVLCVYSCSWFECGTGSSKTTLRHDRRVVHPTHTIDAPAGDAHRLRELLVGKGELVVRDPTTGEPVVCAHAHIWGERVVVVPGDFGGGSLIVTYMVPRKTTTMWSPRTMDCPIGNTQPLGMRTK